MEPPRYGDPPHRRRGINHPVADFEGVPFELLAQLINAIPGAEAVAFPYAFIGITGMINYADGTTTCCIHIEQGHPAHKPEDGTQEAS